MAQPKGIGYIIGYLSRLKSGLGLDGAIAGAALAKIQTPYTAPDAPRLDNNPPANFPKISDASHPFQVLARRFMALARQDVLEGFQSQHDPNTGDPWPEKMDQRNPLLIRSGYMMTRALSVLENPVISEAGSAVSAIADMHDEPWYAKYHQAGTQKIPRRTFFGFSKQTVDDVTHSATEFAAEITATR